jgi:carboxypeptidase Q
MNRLIRQLITSLAIIASLGAPAFAQQGRGPSTPEEQARVVQLAAAADKDPLGVMASAEGRWFEQWAEEVPDFMLGPDNGVFWIATKAAKGELKRVVRFQHTVSTAAFQIKHHIADPTKDAAQMEAKALAGVEGLLRAYETLLASNPDNRSAKLDQAIALRNKGELAAFVKALPPMPER